MLTIFLPITCTVSAKNFYKKNIGFENASDDLSFYVPNMEKKAIINLQDISSNESYEIYKDPSELKFTSFRYSIKNFQEYTESLVKKDIRFCYIAEYPGGADARVIDPFGNTFIYSSDEETDDTNIDKSNWPEYISIR